MPDDLARLEAVREGLIATQLALERDRKDEMGRGMFVAVIVVVPIDALLIRAVVLGQLSIAFLVWGIVIGLTIGLPIVGWLNRGFDPDSKVGLICAVVLAALFGAPILEPRDERPKVVRELLTEIERRIALLKSSTSPGGGRP
jgi:hypothetical protein